MQELSFDRFHDLRLENVELNDDFKNKDRLADHALQLAVVVEHVCEGLDAILLERFNAFFAVKEQLDGFVLPLRQITFCLTFLRQLCDVVHE